MKRFALLIGVFILSAAWSTRPVWAQTAEAVEEARATGFVKSVQSGSADSVLAYMAGNWVPASDGDIATRRAGLARRLVEEQRDLQIVGVTADAPHHIDVHTHTAAGDPLAFQFDFETEAPHRITGLSVKLGEPGPALALPDLALPAHATSEQTAEVLNAWFNRLAADDVFSGAVLVAAKGKTVFTGAWGLASKRWNVPNSVDTRFDLGSINKSFTQIAIGQLLQAGKLALDTPFAAYLPDYPNPEVARAVTVRQLLSHTSGLGDIFNDRFFRSSRSRYRSPRDFFELFADEPLKFQPGTGRFYSNAGYMVLGAIIEAVSGEPYDEYVARHIFGPAGMTRSGFFAVDDPVADVAEGYTVPDDQADRAPAASRRYRSNILMLPARGNSAGSAQSTVGDLLKFDRALRENRLLSPAYTAWYFGADAPADGAPPVEGAARNLAPMGIAGGAPGLNADLESDGELTIIVLANYDPPIAEAVAQKLQGPLKAVLSTVR